jgi:hypothetical protein
MTEVGLYRWPDATLPKDHPGDKRDRPYGNNDQQVRVSLHSPIFRYARLPN